ncbi:hypothetical protein [Clostridium baratii]|uniref:hypothetical protein n=1 Tax=Clostridium baratii TaxID=1561 RepID=UPI0030D5467A
MRGKIPHLECRGNEKRIRIVEEYDIELVRYSRLLNGQIKKSDANDKIKDRYYVFLCTSKRDKSERVIECGSHVAREFMRLANISPIKLFNPLNGEERIENNNNNSNNSNNKKWNKTVLELYNAINILEMYWDIVLTGILLEIKKELRDNPYLEPQVRRIKAVNTCISKSRKSITEIIEILRENNDIREFNFDNLNKILLKHEEKSWF